MQILFLAAFILGCLLGWVRAARRGGNLADRAQYALAHGIPIALATLAVLIGLAWLNAG
ncbi:MAG TPA: hypothetical protein VMM59_05370 [Thermohalobaculum sp.]|nr:hypothetical protein [Thermohalobaculum sp.]